MSDDEIIQAKAIPLVESVENRGNGHGGVGYGFVNFSELNYQGQRVRVGWLGAGVDSNVGYLFAGNWGMPGAGHFAAAWEALAKSGIDGFTLDTDVPDMSDVWVSTGDNMGVVMLGDLKNMAIKEHRKFIAKIRKLAKR